MYSKFFPGNPFNYFFLDEYFNQQYQSDLKFGEIVGSFSTFTVFITVLGLFGLTLFSTTQRLKEIAIRKVLGANVNKIFIQFAKEFVVLVLVSFVIVSPITYYGLDLFLNDYAFRIILEPQLFFIPLLIVLGVTLTTVSAQIFKAALVNPGIVLKYE